MELQTGYNAGLVAEVSAAGSHDVRPTAIIGLEGGGNTECWWRREIRVRYEGEWRYSFAEALESAKAGTTIRLCARLA